VTKTGLQISVGVISVMGNKNRTRIYGGLLCAHLSLDAFLTDTTDKAIDATKDQTQDSIVEGVREGVKSIFKKVW
jgi:hypothetical protein